MPVAVFNVPEYILINVKVPTKGSVATLNAKAEKNSLSSNFLSISSLESGLVPLIEPMSMGLGRNLQLHLTMAEHLYF